jgi:GT2 family glycosyltransferase
MTGAADVAGPPAGLGGVVVTYHPDETVADNLRAMVRECGRVVVVDNGSSAEVCRWIAAVSGVELLALGENRGVATALNRGVARARENGWAWIVTFDQDSVPQPGMVAAMWATHGAVPRAAVIGPRIAEAGSIAARYRWVRRHPRWPGLFQRVACTDGDLKDVTMLVTSGSLVEIALWQELGGFDEALFIDYIDTDYCLRVIRAGRQVAVSAGAVLEHRLGARRRERWLGQEFRPTHHAAFRHYYIARNRVRVWRRHALAAPHWALFDLSFAVFNTFRVLACEPERWPKLKAMLLGTWDGLGGRSGPCPAHRQAALES